jgi:hypothetical protein
MARSCLRAAAASGAALLSLSLVAGADAATTSAPATSTGAAANATAAASAGPAATAKPVRLTAALAPGARLGGASPLRIGLHVDPRAKQSPVDGIQLRYPGSLGITTSGLGIAACRHTQAQFDNVVVDHGIGLVGCSPNAVIATGTATGAVHNLDTGEKLTAEVGTITVLTGPLTRDRLDLVAQVTGWHPVGAKLVYAGRLTPSAPPYGGAMSITVPQIPPTYGATVTLLDLNLTLGSSDIVYKRRAGGRTVSYRPGGIALPARCPRGGFRFAASFHFADGSTSSDSATARCPRR